MPRWTLALYHLHLKNISRGDGAPDRPRSAVACAAYRAGETLWNEAEERESKFGGRRDVVFSEIRLPDGAPAWMADRTALWNAVEARESRRDARLAKEVEFALPRELPRANWVAVALEMADAYASRGFAVDLAIHDDGSLHNPHVHMMMTTRLIGPEGFGNKLRELDGKAFLKELRAIWEAVANAALAKAGVASGIDARSHAARGIDRDPGQHQGPDPAARRERRDRTDNMPMDPKTAAAHRELTAEQDVRERFPLMSSREDWPPVERSKPAFFSTPERQEEDRFWNEIDRRAQPANPVVERPELAADIERMLERVHIARGAGTERQPDVLPALRDAYDSIRDKLVLELVKAQLIAPQTARHLHELDKVLYKDEFERNLAEARRHEAKRREVGHWPEPTRQQLKAVAEQERLEEDRKFDECDRMRAAAAAQVPDPDGNPIRADDLEQAETRMLNEVEGPGRSQAAPPRPERISDQNQSREEARDAIQRAADLPVSDRKAVAYRLAPQERSREWIEAERPRDSSSEPAQQPSRTLEYLRQRLGGQRPVSRRDDGPDRNPERDERR